MTTREHAGATPAPRWQSAGAGATTTTGPRAGQHSGHSTSSLPRWSRPQLEHPLFYPPQGMRMDATSSKSPARQGLFEVRAFTDAPCAAPSELLTETAGDISAAGPDMKRNFTPRVQPRGCACLTLTALALTVCASAWKHPHFVEIQRNRLGSSGKARDGGTPCPAALLGALPTPRNCTVEAAVPLFVVAGCRVSTLGADAEANVWSCSMPSCSDAVEELAHACPAEIRQMKDLHLNGRQQMPPARKKQWNQVQKTLTLLAPGLNLTSFLDDCTRVIQTRAHPRAHGGGPPRARGGVQVRREHVVVALLVAVVIGIALKVTPCKHYVRTVWRKGTARYQLHESVEHHNLGTPPETAAIDAAALWAPGGTDLKRGFTLRVHQRRCPCLALAALTLTICAVTWKYSGGPANAKVDGGAPCPASLLGARKPTNCTVEAAVPVIIAAGCQTANLWSCSVPSCTDAVEQLSGACADEWPTHWSPQAQRTAALLAPGLDLAIFADDCTRAIQARVHQSAQEGGQVIVYRVAGISFVVALVAVAIGMTVRNRKRRRPSEFSRESARSDNPAADGSPRSGTDSDVSGNSLTAVQERSTELEKVNDFPPLVLSPLDLEALPPVDSAMDASENSKKHDRRKAKLAERAALRSQKLLARVQTDPSLPPGVESALWLGDQAPADAAVQEAAAAAAAERLTKMVADDSPVEEWLNPELLPRINLTSKEAKGAMKSLDADADTAEEAAAGLVVATGGRRVSRLESNRPDARHHCPFPGCTYASVGTGHLFRHFKIHTREKPFSCDWPGCNYSAAHQGHLIEHKRGHTGEKPFKCDFPGCDYASARSWHVTRHVKSVHDNQDGSATPLESAAE